jgi:hypothetical protein
VIPRPQARSLDVLAAALAENQRYDEATAAATQALTLAKQSPSKDQAAEISRRLDLYRSHQPFRDTTLVKKTAD